MTHHFVLAQAADIPDITRLLHAAFTPYVQQLGYQKTGPYPWLGAAIEAQQIFVAKDTREIIGVMCLKPVHEGWEIAQFGIAPGHQNTGVGRWMMEETETRARAAGAHRLTLFTGEMMAGLVQFYMRQGFVETHRALPAHGEDTHLRVHMEKRL